jgi:2-polyprenyl-3-methyl-5-hydroxy-6-metoxy-1,4-benzoquinol methylase
LYQLYCIFGATKNLYKIMSSIITWSKCPCCSGTAILKVLDCKDYTVSGEIFEVWQCADCGLCFTQHVPDQQSIGRYYQSDTYISHTDTEKGLVNKLYKVARNYTLNWKMKLVTRHTGKVKGNLLDIGAGTGAFVNAAVSQDWSATGLEPDEGARNICQEKYSLQLGNPGKLFELPSNQFDAVTMWHVLEHVHQLHEYLDEVKRVLKKDGVALIALPNYTSDDARLYGAAWAAYDVPRHLYHFAPSALRKLADVHALKVDGIKPMWLDAFYIAMLSEGYKNGKPNMPAAVLNGARSNWHARRNTEKCSSLVYIIRHL